LGGRLPPLKGQGTKLYPAQQASRAVQRNLCHEQAFAAHLARVFGPCDFRIQGRAPKTQQKAAGKATGEKRPPIAGVDFLILILYQCCNVPVVCMACTPKCIQVPRPRSLETRPPAKQVPGSSPTPDHFLFQLRASSVLLYSLPGKLARGLLGATQPQPRC